MQVHTERGISADAVKFDEILMKDVIEHVPNDQELLKKAAEALVPGGLLVLSTQNSLSLNYLLEGFYQKYILGNKNWVGWDETHLRFYTPMSLRRKLEDAGFRLRLHRSVYLFPYTFSKKLTFNKKYFRLNVLSVMDRCLGSIFPYSLLGWNIIVSAQTSPEVKSKAKSSESIADMAVLQPV
jgi:2-polyprenyl-6-hydroxyphenyl methylase/3-demethylubiquinone-9 3-methyltransferase